MNHYQAVINGNNMLNRKPVYASIMVLCATFIFAIAAEAQSSATVLLAGYKQVPPVPSPASGKLTFTLTGDTLAVEGAFEGLTSPFWGAYIHYGAADERGNQIIELNPELNEQKTGGYFDPAQNSFVLNSSQKQALSQGLLYVNIYSSEYQRGEIRGQLPTLK
jgi:hypothetical protein